MLGLQWFSAEKITSKTLISFGQDKEWQVLDQRRAAGPGIFGVAYFGFRFRLGLGLGLVLVLGVGLGLAFSIHLGLGVGLG